MWDSSFMADINNFSEINENFDTIKTLLNSIRAQGILNTSDVDKLLSGINTKLEKINTEEDIDLIKIFLSELKQNLDERHSVLISKFGAIESLFTNLLKNSSEMPKSADLKELFDIVATNLSVFSREVISQKETLTDITLRLDALRSDDSQKKDIIKNIALLKPDLERLNNGFDSIVLSLNDNFKTIIKTITTIDKTEYLDKFSDSLNSIEMSSNTVLSALQMLDKKTGQVEVALNNLATKDDITTSNQRLFELTAQNQELTAVVTDFSDKYVRIENLADKIDATVNIIASLKTAIEETEDKNSNNILEQLRNLESQIATISSDTKFEEFKISLEGVLKNIFDGTVAIDKSLMTSSLEIQKVINLINGLDINVGLQSVLSAVDKVETGVKNSIHEVSNKIITLQDANITRVLNDISSGAETIGSKLNQTQSAISDICEKNFGSVFANITDLKNLIAQLDENSVSANNAIFSSITDRLTVFENSLRVSLDAQEKTVNNSSAQLVEQIDAIKNLSSVIDYKMDSSVVEVGNIKREFEALKSSIDEVLALDFVNTVKDLRVDLYASKQEMVNSFESTNADLSEKVTNDLYGKYELLISKLDSVEDEFKKTQSATLIDLKGTLDKISNSIVDVLSYVSETKPQVNENIDDKISEIAGILKENSLSYIESVRDVVDVIRIQVENNIQSLSENNSVHFESVKRSISENSEDIKKEIKYSYSKLLEIQDSYNEIKDLLNVNSMNSSGKIDEILVSAETVKSDFENKLNSLKNALLDKVSDFKQEFTCENADKVSELKFSVENLYNKHSQELTELINGLREQFKVLSTEDSHSRTATLAKILDNFILIKDLLKTYNEQDSADLTQKVESILEDISSVKDFINTIDENAKIDLAQKSNNIIESLDSIKELIGAVDEKSTNNIEQKTNNILVDLSSIKDIINNFNKKSESDLTQSTKSIVENINSAIDFVKNLNNKSEADLSSSTESIIDKINSVVDLVQNLNEKSESALSDKVNTILDNFTAIKTILDKVDENIDGDMTRQLSIIESNFESLVSQITILFDKSDKSLSDKINDEFSSVSEKMQEMVSEKLETYKLRIEETFDKLQDKASEQSKYLQERIVDLNSVLKSLMEEQSENNDKRLEEVATTLKEVLDENIKLTAVDYVALKNKLVDFAKNIETNNQALTQDVKTQLDDITKYIDSVLEIQANESQSMHEELSNTIKDSNDSVKALIHEQAEFAKNTDSKISDLSDIANKNSSAIDAVTTLVTEQHEEVLTKESSLLTTAQSIEATAQNTESKVETVQTDLSSLAKIVEINKGLLNDLGNSLDEKAESLKSMVAEVSVGELQTMDTYIEKVSEQLAVEKEQIELCKNLIVDILKNNFESISKNIEKETDVIIGELIEQFELLRKSQADDVVNLTSRMEEIVNAHIYNNIEDLKSYLDIKTDNSVVTSKLDNLKVEMQSSVDNIVDNLNKLLDSNVFTTSMSDFRVANEILVNSSVDRLNAQIESFIKENGKQFENKLALFDKKFVDTVVDKYEEIKLIANKYNESFDSIQNSINDVFANFAEVKDSVNQRLDVLTDTIKTSIESTNKEVRKLNECFENLRSQISNKSFDEAFQASINKQIANLETLVDEQLGYIEDINDLCANNLPDVTELNTLVKNSILESINKFSEKMDSCNNLIVNSKSDVIDDISNKIDSQNIENNLNQIKTDIIESVSEKIESQEFENNLNLVKEDIIAHITDKAETNEIEQSLNQLKSDIITQFLNVFNQISFIAEQEEILDFIQDKHDELITVLSHIVTTSAEVGAVKDNLSVVDNKIDSLKDDIELLNEKITAIMSSDGDIDYVYSLQELESDIAGLRVVLNEMKESNNSQAFADLISSTDEIYKLMESIKQEFPNKRDFEGMAEDIVSISTRTNKLILASDESYKTLQDNLQDFKLVINDLDERTRNFAQESGMDRIDSKLNSLNTMLINGAKTNQVFNQVFEYLAEWVDNAGVQINEISSRIESLNDIEQIKLMLADLKAESADNSESVELVEALGAIFDKQVKKIASLETKLDKIIVETTINNRVDMSPMEDTLNRFLVAIDEKMTSQQSKINSLESKLEGVISLLDEKDTAQLTKKVGGMDRQIAKLNKSIEKIASHVVEK